MIDKRRKYIMMVDTETANTLVNEDGTLCMDCVLVYDIGWQVIDKQGRVYEEKSYVVREIFKGEKELMRNAYYAEKIPMYLKEIAEGKRVVASFYQIRKDFIETMKRYGSSTVAAHNAKFDYTALNNTQRWLTKSKYRFFFPFGTEVWDTLKMARSVIADRPTYRQFCEENDYLTVFGKVRLTAEILFRYISLNKEFIECHTGLEDVDIERQILAYCFKTHKAMEKVLWD